MEVADPSNRLGLFLDVECKTELDSLEETLKEAVAVACVRDYVLFFGGRVRLCNLTRPS